MNTRFFAFLALLSALCSCAGINDPERPEPSPTPFPEQANGPWLIRELDSNGKVVQEWEAKSYRHKSFPRTVEFMDAAGHIVRITGSFQIVQKP